MQGLSRDVVLRVGVGRSAVEYQSLLVSILVGKGDFDMKLLLVEDFDLQGQEWLQQEQVLLARLLRQLQLRAEICDVHVAFDTSIVGLLDGATDKPSLDGFLVLDV